MPTITHAVQAIGLASVPLHDMPKDKPIAHRPVAAAIVTLQQRDDGHREIVATTMSVASDAVDTPLVTLTEQALLPTGVRLISPADRLAIAAEAIAQRRFSEPRLVELAIGARVVDPAEALGGDEAAAFRRLQIPAVEDDAGSIEHAFVTGARRALEQSALCIAAARMMLWAHTAGWCDSDPAPFFDTHLTIRDWIEGDPELASTLRAIAQSRPIRAATTLAPFYRQHLARRAAGDTDTSWYAGEGAMPRS